MISKFSKKIKHHFHEVIRIKTSPHSVALGFAIGAFIAILPTPGFSLLIGLLIVLIFEKVNKFALFGAIIIFNPIINSPIYYLSYKIGNLLFGSVPVVKYNLVIINKIYNFSRRFLIGNAMIASTLSFCLYFIIKKIVKRHQKKH